jgi:hypothetical protein
MMRLTIWLLVSQDLVQRTEPMLVTRTQKRIRPVDRLKEKVYNENVHAMGECARTELIKSAIAIDAEITRERGLPRVFRGKVSDYDDKMNIG